MTFSAFVRRRASDFLDYDTPKFVHIRSKKIGALCRITQLLCLCYVVGYDLVYEKGYQKQDEGVSGVTAKVKGLQFTDAATGLPGGAPRIWDTADYVVPPHMNGAFFVMTNLVATHNQSQGRCSEDPSVAEARCSGDADCAPPGKIASAGNGAFTGKCLLPAADGAGGGGGGGMCEIVSWCPLEDDTLTRPSPILSSARNFTVLIKNYVYFPYYNKYRSNILETANKQYLRTCVYNAVTDPQCPVFRIGDVVSAVKGESFDSLALLGGVISIRIGWDCDLDYSISSCLPRYSFARLDGDATDALAAQGYNFRYSYNYEEGGAQRRTLVKAYGILFVVSVSAKAGAFHVIPLLLKVGSGLGLLGVSTVLCDFIVANVYRKRHEIKQKKFDRLDKSVSGERAGADTRKAASS